MKRKLFTLFVLLILSIQVFAQLEVKENSFKEVNGFVNINTEKMFDDNDKPYAVLKVKTENINDKERHQLLFQGDARTFIECEYNVGEVWVYISYYATYLKISHPDFGSTEFWFPFDMKGKKGYELTLYNKPSLEEDFMKRLEALEKATVAGINNGEYGYVVIKTTPVNGATVLIDGDEMEMKTPFVSDKLGIGHHRIRVVKNNYKPYVTVVTIEDGKTVNLDVELIEAVGSLKIVTTPDGVNVRINKEDKGTTPMMLNNIQVGTYKIELSKKKYKTVVKDVNVKDDENTLVDVVMERIVIQKPDVPRYKFITLNAAIDQYSDLSYGFTFGIVKRFGWFVSGMSNFSFQGLKSDYECKENFYVGNVYPEYTGKETYTIMSVIGGALITLSENYVLMVGAGYGMNNTVYETSDNKWVKNASLSVQGLTVSLGVQHTFHRFVVSLETGAINFNIFETKIGLGYGFKNY